MKQPQQLWEQRTSGSEWASLDSIPVATGATEGYFKQGEEGDDPQSFHGCVLGAEPGTRQTLMSNVQAPWGCAGLSGQPARASAPSTHGHHLSVPGPGLSVHPETSSAGF